MMRFGIAFLVFFVAANFSRGVRQEHAQDLHGGNGGRRASLVADTCGMETAWDVPMNPLTDTITVNLVLAEEIRYGFKLFTGSTTKPLPFSVNQMTCSDCHLNAGQRARALPLVGVAGKFPEHNKRAGRLFSLEDRILECYKRSLNASQLHSDSQNKTEPISGVILSTKSREVLAISAYIAWISASFSPSADLPWRGQNTIASHNLIAVDKLDSKRGAKLYAEKCTNCHGEDGQGVEIGDKKAGPLWGPGSWNDGAGAGRIYTLAGMIRYMMPYMSPGSVTDEEAQQLSAFIDAQPRPSFPMKKSDFPTEKIPDDAVYYKR
jgi:thiosulfate dehydrogenase